MFLEKVLKNKYFVVLFFVMFLVLIFREAIFNGDVIMQGDYPYFWPFSNRGQFFVWEESFMGISHLSAMFGKILIISLPQILDRLFFPHNIISYLLNLGPILILTLLVFHYSRKISGNIYFAYFAGLFIILNNHMFAQLIYWPGHYFYGVIALILLFYKSYQIYLNDKINKNDIIIIALFSLLCVHPFFLVMYLLYLLFFILFYLFQNYSKNIILKFSLIVFLILALSAYWIVPFLHNLIISTATNVYRGGGLGPFHGMKRIANYINFYSLMHFPLPEILTINSIYKFFNHFFSVFVIGVIPLIFIIKNKLNKKDKYFILFLVFIFLFFFNLALGPNSVLTGKLWMWSLENVSFFTFFRSFTRFLIVSVVSLVFILSIFIKGWQYKYKSIIIIFFILLLIISNIKIISGDLGGTLLSGRVPNEYFNINKTYFQEDSIQSKVISYPGTYYEQNPWNANKLGRVGVYFKHNFFSKPVAFYHTSSLLDKKNDLFGRIFLPDNKFIFYDDFDKELDLLNIGYILVQKDLIDILSSAKKIEYERYVDYFSSKNDYELLDDNQYFALYKNKKFSPLIDTNEVLFQKINATKYKIYLKNLSQKKSLSFLESNHPEWKLYLKKNPTNFWCEKLEYYKDVDAVECKHSQKIFEGEELAYLWNKPVFDDTHHLSYDYANSWTIDPELVEKNYSGEYYKKNSDGSIDLELILYFKPQSSYYLGLSISVIILVVCFGCFVYNRKK